MKYLLNRCVSRLLLITLWLAGVSGQAAYADYVPDTIEFPDAPPMVFESQPSLNLASGGAIEFWVVADWQDNPGYHPVVLTNGGDSTPLYRISIAADKAALIVQSGSDYGQFAFDFDDGRTHHVALLDFDSEIVAIIDGKFAGVVAMSIQPGPAGKFYVGSAAQGQSHFVGAISALRIWDLPLEPEEIVAFALRDVSDPRDPHPNLDNLVGYSDFRDSAFVIVDAVVIEESDLLSPQDIAEVLGDDQVRALDREFAVE